MNKEIKCPGCGTWETVGHLKWSALSCPTCKTFYDLAPWLLSTKMAEEEEEQQMAFMSVLNEFAENVCEPNCNCDDH